MQLREVDIQLKSYKKHKLALIIKELQAAMIDLKKLVSSLVNISPAILLRSGIKTIICDVYVRGLYTVENLKHLSITLTIKELQAAMND